MDNIGQPERATQDRVLALFRDELGYHNGRFSALMDRFMPKWQFDRAELNRLPVRHEDWNF